METIKLLDGKDWKMDEILKEMEDDEFYYGYLGKAALSSSNCKMLLDSPKTYKYVTQYGSASSQALRDGWLFHTAILEPEVFEKQIFVNVESKNAKAYQEAKKEHDKVFTKKEKRDAERLADAFYKNETARSYITNCNFEHPAIGLVKGYPFRAKADVLCKDMIVDLKTTIDIKSFKYSAYKNSYDMQCYLYCQLFGMTYDQFKFIGIDKKSLDIGVYHCSEEFYLSGEQKVEAAIKTYEAFFVDGLDIDDYYLEGIL